MLIDRFSGIMFVLCILLSDSGAHFVPIEPIEHLQIVQSLPAGLSYLLYI